MADRHSRAPWVSSGSRASSRSRSAAGSSSRSRAAASASASGSPSRRRQIPAIVSLASRSRRNACARSRNSSTAAPSGQRAAPRPRPTPVAASGSSPAASESGPRQEPTRRPAPPRPGARSCRAAASPRACSGASAVGPERLEHRRHDELGVAAASARLTKKTPSDDLVEQLGSDLKRQARLARAARTRDRDEPPSREQAEQLLLLGRTADERMTPRAGGSSGFRVFSGGNS